MMADKKYVDEVTGTETTGHEWDGIQELDTPMPKWWLYTLYATVIWSVGYVIAYPAFPISSSISESSALGWSSRGRVADQIAEARAAQSVFTDQIAAKSIEEVMADPDLLRFSQAGGAATFRAFCSQCHGGAGSGRPGGYPTLQDDDWLWGGSIEELHHTIANGIRNEESPDARFSQMPAFGADGILGGEEIAQVVEHVLNISGQEHDAALAAEGATVFAENCAACHGETGTGDKEQGAPNLTDAIWLYGGERENITQTVRYSRAGVMPAWAYNGYLSDYEIKMVAIYVHSLGGGL
jgi:cytochrome c oxidase cbb3-type subunit 3